MEKKIQEQPPERELSGPEKRIAVSLESLRSSLETKDIIFIMLIWREFKKASAVSLGVLSVKEEMELKANLKRAGLCFMKTDKIVDRPDRGLKLGGTICFVADNQENLNLISRLWFEDDNKLEVHNKLGELSGYPSSAIKAYDKVMQTETPKREKTKEDIFFSEEEKVNFLKKEPDLIPFSFLFYMSKENWKNEMETVRQWAKELKLIGQGTYHSFLNEFYFKHPEIQK